MLLPLAAFLQLHLITRVQGTGGADAPSMATYAQHALRNPETGVCREASRPEIQVAKDARRQDARTPGCKPTASRHRKPTGQTQGTQGRLCSRHRISGLASPISQSHQPTRGLDGAQDARRETRRSRWARGVGFRPGMAVRRQAARPIGTLDDERTNARSGVTATGHSRGVIWASGNWLNASRVRQGARSARCEPVWVATHGLYESRWLNSGFRCGKQKQNGPVKGSFDGHRHHHHHRTSVGNSDSSPDVPQQPSPIPQWATPTTNALVET
ncbi:hypothetical protein BKA56DRAFT_611447 [Ilyonectria sp. MPI-CAGE-AT-0026]|nr:hypothetical protein BKA56DRAFT_611447 [Ilyonectria sp. MPI-CAGE-AT-0026]